MLDIKFIRENTDIVKDAIRKKRIDFDVEQLLTADDKRRALLGQVEAMRAEQNEATARIAQAAPKERDEEIKKMRELKESLTDKEKELAELMKEWRSLMLSVPNVPDA